MASLKPGCDNDSPSLPPTDADGIQAMMPVAVRGRDPRPPKATEARTDDHRDLTMFTSFGVLSVSFWPEDRVFYAWSRSVLEILANEPRFNDGKLSPRTTRSSSALTRKHLACFLVKGLDGTGSEFSMGVIERSHATPTQGWRLPLRVYKRSSVHASFHQVHLVIKVILEQVRAAHIPHVVFS